MIHPELTKTANKTSSEPRLRPILDPDSFPELEALLYLLVEDGSDFPHVADCAVLDPMADFDSRGGVQTILPASLKLRRLRSVTESRVHVGHDLVMLRLRILLRVVVTSSSSSSHSVKLRMMLLWLLWMLLRVMLL